MLPPGSVTRIGSATESMIRSSRSRSARTSASAWRSSPVVLLDLLGGAPQVGDVAQHRHDAGALAGVAGRPCSAARRAGRSRRPDRPAAARGAAPRAPSSACARQRGREQHVVQRHRAAPALALVLAGGEQRLGARVGDHDAAVGVGEEDRVGDGVDDAVEQRVLVAELLLGSCRWLAAVSAARRGPSTRPSHWASAAPAGDSGVNSSRPAGGALGSRARSGMAAWPPSPAACEGA